MLKLIKLDDGSELLINPQSQNIELPEGTIQRLLVIKPTPNVLYDFKSISPMSFLQLLSNNMEKLKTVREEEKLRVAEELGLQISHPIPSVELLPGKISYKIPNFSSSAHCLSSEIKNIWSDKVGEYQLSITRHEDGDWEISYIHYNIYEGYPEVYLPAKSDDEIEKLIRGVFGKDKEEIDYWLIDYEILYASTKSQTLEKSAKKVLDWLKHNEKSNIGI